MKLELESVTLRVHYNYAVSGLCVQILCSMHTLLCVDSVTLVSVSLFQ